MGDTGDSQACAHFPPLTVEVSDVGRRGQLRAYGAVLSSGAVLRVTQPGRCRGVCPVVVADAVSKGRLICQQN